MPNLTPNLLKKIATTASELKCSLYASSIQKYAEQFKLTTPERMAAFLSQVLHESGNFQFVRELWGPTPQQQNYESSVSLGNTEKGDGFKFRGRGLIQVTGRANYKVLSDRMFGDERLLTSPALLEQPEYATLSALYYWDTNDLNKLADAIEKGRLIADQFTMTEFKALRKRVNGGYNGLAQCIDYYNKAIKVLNQQ